MTQQHNYDTTTKRLLAFIEYFQLILDKTNTIGLIHNNTIIKETLITVINLKDSKNINLKDFNK